MAAEINIKIKADYSSDVEMILQLVAKQINDGYTSGFDRNEDSRYEYTIEGELDADEAKGG